MTRWKVLRYIISIALILFAVSKLYPYLDDLHHLKKLQESINPFIVLLAASMQILQYAADGWLSKTLLKMIHFDIKFKDTLRIAALDIFTSHLFPVGRLGSLAAVFYFYKKLGIETEAIVFEVAAWAAMTSCVLLVIFFGSLFFLPSEFSYFPLNPGNIFFIFSLLVIIVIAFYFLTKGKLIRFVIKSYLERYKWSTSIVTFLQKWRTYKRLMLSHPKLLIQAVIAAALYYLGDIAMLSLCFFAFGLKPSFAILTFGYTASLIAGIITLAPAGLGATDATLAIVFLATKMDPVTSVGAILLFRLITFWLPIPAGALSYFSLKQQVSNKAK